MSGPLASATRYTVGVRDIPLVLVSPRRVFARIEDVRAWGWPLVVLLALVTLVGYATVQTGLIDREVDRDVRERIAQIESVQRDVVERSALREMYAQEHKKGEFTKLLQRIRVVIAAPALALASALLTAAACYGVVALTGRKAEWHTLLTICVFAGYVDWLRLVLTLALMLTYRTLDVDTSLGLLVQYLPPKTDVRAVAAAAGALTALDPFRIWYWSIVILGLSVTAQLPGWRAWLIAVLCWLSGAAARCALAVAPLMSMPGGRPPG